MEPALVLAVAVGMVCGVPLVVTGLGVVLGGATRWGVTTPGRVAPVAALLLALRAVPSPAAPPPPGERLALVERHPAVPDQASPRPAPPLPAAQTSTYRVVAGDSLWAIACRFLSVDGSVPSDADINRYWRIIYAANRQVVGADPDLIFPGQLLAIPPEA